MTETLCIDDELIKYPIREVVQALEKSTDDERAILMEKLTFSPRVLAFLVFHLRWLPPWLEELVEALASEHTERRRKNQYPSELDGFSLKQLELLLSHVVTFEVTRGCSFGCGHCGFDAAKGIREQMPYAQLERLYKDYGALLYRTMPSFYYASEPLDYAWKDKRYPDLVKMVERLSGYVLYTTTQLPVRSQEAFKELHRIGRIDRVSALQSFKHHDPDVITIVQRYHDQTEFHRQVNLKPRHTGLHYDPRHGHVRGIGCFNGVLVTAHSVYNEIQLPSCTSSFPQGQIVTPLALEARPKPIHIGDDILDHLPHYVVGFDFNNYKRVSSQYVFLFSPQAPCRPLAVRLIGQEVVETGEVPIDIYHWLTRTCEGANLQYVLAFYPRDWAKSFTEKVLAAYPKQIAGRVRLWLHKHPERFREGDSQLWKLVQTDW